MRTTAAPQVSRGVLDTVRDSGADALVIGAATDPSGRMTVGTIGEAILGHAPCDVYVLGTHDDRGLEAVERVVVAVGDPANAGPVLRCGVVASQTLNQPLEVVHAQPNGTSHPSRVRGLVADLAGGGPVVTTTIPHRRLDAGLHTHIRDSDLIIAGYEHPADGQGWAEGSLTRRVLAAHDVSVLTVAPHRTRDPEPLRNMLRRARAWLHPRLTDVEQHSVRDMAAAASQLRLDFLLMILLSGMIAAFGLRLDSVAIIIGAMLVAPLMPPIQSFGIAVVDGRATVASRAAATVLVGAAIVILGSFALGLVGDGELTDEIAARGAPSLLDAGVALAAGIAGAYATARKTIPAALAGVAIAAALVPPLAVVGLSAAAGAWDLAVGAFLLFTVNIACVAVTTAGVFTWLGLEAFDPAPRRRGGHHHLLLAVLVLVLALALSVALRADRPVLDADVLADAVRDASQHAASFVDATTTEVEGQPTVRVLVDVEVPDAEGGQPDSRPLMRRVLSVLEQEVTSQLGDEVQVKIVRLETISTG